MKARVVARSERGLSAHQQALSHPLLSCLRFLFSLVSINFAYCKEAQPNPNLDSPTRTEPPELV